MDSRWLVGTWGLEKGMPKRMDKGGNPRIFPSKVDRFPRGLGGLHFGIDLPPVFVSPPPPAPSSGRCNHDIRLASSDFQLEAHQDHDDDDGSFPIAPTLFLPLCPRPRLRLRFRLRDPVSLFASVRPHIANDTPVPARFRHHGCSLAAGRPRPRRLCQCLPYS